MNDEQKQREAFYLIKKYSSYTWYSEIYRLWKQFCDGYERDFYRTPMVIPGGRYAGQLYEPNAWDEQNLQMFWGYAASMEEGLATLANGDKVRGYALLADGMNFGGWLYSRRFEEMDLSDLGYRRSPVDISEGVFVYAQKAHAMIIATCICTHTDSLRRDYLALPDNPSAVLNRTEQQLQLPIGVPPGILPDLPVLDSSAPNVMTDEEVPAMGIWVVEPDTAHNAQTYCMAYLRQWVPAIETVSEQEYEKNSRWIRTRDEAYRKDSDKIKDYPVRWRLLWRDERDYSNGNVPPEEADYLIYREPTELPIIDFIGLRIEAGQACPQAGYWFAPAKLDSRHFFSQGEIMPSFDSSTYGATIWQWSDDQSAA
jgi:hypothetical protein